jgi:hypothetical protein
LDPFKLGTLNWVPTLAPSFWYTAVRKLVARTGRGVGACASGCAGLLAGRIRV